MLFTSPLWLLAILPWAGAVLWLLWGRRRKTPVAFLDLWKGPALQKPAKRALQPPPIYLGLALISLLLALLAAAKPRVLVRGGGAGTPINVIVDRGLSMSATAGAMPRFQSSAKHAGEQIASVLPASTPVNLLLLPGKGETVSSVGDWAATLDHVAPSAVDTQALVEETIRDRLANGTGAVVIISDRQVPIHDSRLIQFSSDTAVDNIGIVHLAARDTPLPQMMVRLRNDSARKSVGLTITYGTEQITKAVDLPPAGHERDYFFDLPKLDEVVEASLDAKDDQPADDRAWLVREGSYPKIETRTTVSAEIRRMIDVYTQSRPGNEASQIIAVVGAEADLPSDSPAVWIAPATGPTLHGAISTTADPQTGDTTLTGDVNWSAFPKDILTAGDPPAAWMPLVSIDGHAIVAVRTEPTRKVWIGFAPSTWAATPDFVVFWANVLTWVGQGQARYAAHPLTRFEPGWNPVETSAPQNLAQKPIPGEWPGLYRTDEGQLRAYHLPSQAPPTSGQTTADWREKLRLADGSGQSGVDLSAALLLLSLAGLAGAAMTWKRRVLTPVSADRTFSVVRK